MLGVIVTVDVEVTVEVDAGRVVVLAVIPTREHADEYRTVLEQTEAYVGIDVGDVIVPEQEPLLEPPMLVTRLLSTVLFVFGIAGAGKRSGVTALFSATGPTDWVLVL